jgi:hypothetical protein
MLYVRVEIENNLTGSNTRDRVEKFSASDGQIVCQYLHFAKTEDIA